MSPTTLTRLVCLLGVAVLLGLAGALAAPQSATAAPHPSFRVVCYPTGMAPNDPIVFPGQAGRSHLHTFFGAKNVDERTTTASLLAQPTSQCGNHYDAVDLSAYWIPTLHQDGVPVYTDSGAHQLTIYYRRAGGPDGLPVAQAMPRSLAMIAGDMHATTPQNHVTYACAHETDTGRQHGGDHTFVSCASDEVLIAKLVFPDCWDGRNLDSADHKSHMAYSQGARGACPSSHPVKLPQITFEAWYFGVNGDAGTFSWSSGSAYTFHGDVLVAWDTTAAANLVNQCINVAVDCNPLGYPAIPHGSVDPAQVDAQLSADPPRPAPPSSEPASSPATSHAHPPRHRCSERDHERAGDACTRAVEDPDERRTRNHPHGIDDAGHDRTDAPATAGRSRRGVRDRRRAVARTRPGPVARRRRDGRATRSGRPLAVLVDRAVGRRLRSALGRSAPSAGAAPLVRPGMPLSGPHAA